MSDLEERDLRRALEAESRATFGDLRRRLEADRPGPCDALGDDVAALATGSEEPEAERHAGECALCRDRADGARDVWRRLAWPASRSRFADLKPHLLAPLPFRVGRAVAAALLAAAIAGALARPAVSPPPGGAEMAGRLAREGLTLPEIAALGKERAARTLIAIGGPGADAHLIAMMGRNPDLDAVIAAALTGRDAGPLHPADVVRESRPDLLPALIDAAPPGSASTIVPALFDPALASRAARALERLPRDEADAALEMAGLGATPEEAEAFAERGIAVAGALSAASRSRAHRTHCFWSAVTGEGGLEFLLAAAGTSVLREDAFMFLDLLPDDAVAAACKNALGHPALAGGAVRVAARLGDRRLVPALMRAAKNPPQGMGAASFELSEGTLISARSESLATVCLEAVQRLNQGR